MSWKPLEPAACFLCGHVAACDGSCGVVCVLDIMGDPAVEAATRCRSCGACSCGTCQAIERDYQLRLDRAEREAK